LESFSFGTNEKKVDEKIKKRTKQELAGVIVALKKR